MMSQTRDLPPRQLLLLDIDENLVITMHSAADKSHISDSVEDYVDEYTLKDVSILPPDSDDDSEEDAAEEAEEKPTIIVRAICRKEWNEAFRKIAEINRKYKELRPDDNLPLITIKFLTNSNACAHEFMTNVFNMFYDATLATYLFSGNYEDYFYNAESQIQLRSSHKGIFMDMKFTQVWEQRYPGLTRENVCLVDDQIKYCQLAQQLHFSYIHNPTTRVGRPSTVFYRNEKERVFTELNAVIAKADSYCGNLAPIPKLARQGTFNKLLIAQPDWNFNAEPERNLRVSDKFI